MSDLNIKLSGAASITVNSLAGNKSMTLNVEPAVPDRKAILTALTKTMAARNVAAAAAYLADNVVYENKFRGFNTSSRAAWVDMITPIWASFPESVGSIEFDTITDAEVHGRYVIKDKAAQAYWGGRAVWAFQTRYTFTADGKVSRCVETTPGTSPEDFKQTYFNCLEAWKRQDMPAILAMLEEGCLINDMQPTPTKGMYVGHDGFMTWVQKLGGTSLIRDMEVKDVVADDEGCVNVTWCSNNMSVKTGKSKKSVKAFQKFYINKYSGKFYRWEFVSHMYEAEAAQYEQMGAASRTEMTIKAGMKEEVVKHFESIVPVLYTLEGLLHDQLVWTSDTTAINFAYYESEEALVANNAKRAEVLGGMAKFFASKPTPGKVAAAYYSNGSYVGPCTQVHVMEEYKEGGVMEKMLADGSMGQYMRMLLGAKVGGGFDGLVGCGMVHHSETKFEIVATYKSTATAEAAGDRAKKMYASMGDVFASPVQRNMYDGYNVSGNDGTIFYGHCEFQDKATCDAWIAAGATNAVFQNTNCTWRESDTKVGWLQLCTVEGWLKENATIAAQMPKWMPLFEKMKEFKCYVAGRMTAAGQEALDQWAAMPMITVQRAPAIDAQNEVVPFNALRKGGIVCVIKQKVANADAAATFRKLQSSQPPHMSYVPDSVNLVCEVEGEPNTFQWMYVGNSEQFMANQALLQNNPVMPQFMQLMGNGGACTGVMVGDVSPEAKACMEQWNQMPWCNVDCTTPACAGSRFYF